MPLSDGMAHILYKKRGNYRKLFPRHWSMTGSYIQRQAGSEQTFSRTDSLIPNFLHKALEAAICPLIFCNWASILDNRTYHIRVKWLYKRACAAM